jgi:DNA-binding GntR family transcriptional regulator
MTARNGSAQRTAVAKRAMRPIERPRSLTQSALVQIRDAIVAGDLGLGQPLSERALSEMLHISKTPVREALAQLRLEGLVRIYPQRGASVFSLSAQEVVEICELRQALESAALRLAVERGGAAFRAALASVVDQMRAAKSAGDRKAYLRHDTAYHSCFCQHSGNSLMAQTYALYAGKIAALRTHLSHKPHHTELSFSEHLAMLEAIEKKDVARALAILDVHIARTRTSYAATIQDIAAADRGADGLPATPRGGQELATALRSR